MNKTSLFPEEKQKGYIAKMATFSPLAEAVCLMLLHLDLAGTACSLETRMSLFSLQNWPI